MNNKVTAAALRAAADATDQLDESGSKVLGHYSNGRVPVLLIDRPPTFVQGVSRRRESDGKGGRVRVYAAPFRGTQLEWRVAEPAAREVAHA
jgi:hypothetical protein